MYYLESFFLWFMCYSVMGWVYESVLCSCMEKELVNRGFLNGPYCPIYGAGAILNLLVLHRVKEPVLLFFFAVLLTGILEYVTSWAMEEIFHARWWDYSDRICNINGRVYLIGAICFGSFSVIQMFFMQPRLSVWTGMLSEEMHSVIALILFTIFLVDLVYTLTKFSEFVEILKSTVSRIDGKMHSVLDDKVQPAIDGRIKSFRDLYGKASDACSSQMARINPQIRRMLISFPKMKSRQYSERFKALRRRIHQELKQKIRR